MQRKIDRQLDNGTKDINEMTELKEIKTPPTLYLRIYILKTIFVENQSTN